MQENFLFIQEVASKLPDLGSFDPFYTFWTGQALNILRIPAMHNHLADMLLFQAKNKPLALRFAHSVVHVCKAEDIVLNFKIGVFLI